MSDNYLSNAIKGTKNGDIKAFEDLFLLTYEACYLDIRVYYENDSIIFDILKDCYINVWNRKEHMPEENLIKAWIRILLKEVIRKKDGYDELNFDFKEVNSIPKNLADKAITILIDIEDIVDYKEEVNNIHKKRNRMNYSKLQLIFMVMIIICVIGISFFVINELVILIGRIIGKVM